ncbi:protein phosphatase 1 regulatory subunit 21-like [Uloborus diversus]|uniref:protein phosphatase 1 regulatory subunit 21-like n=1 Tax=Uloborus diversus TaxID=327109 RepID=UPI0024091861|nr:protein phosphatase 1 regulatory subunit 21-like [Uloborus diversus]
MEENSEVVSKYQKLALEYSKLKAQISVLKTAVAEEQGAVAELHETVKKKDQFIRKLEQEVECLNFRNLQLTKRVSVLQNDLEGVEFHSKHSKGKHPASNSSPFPESYAVLNAELQSRIEENEKLHQKLYSAETDHKSEIANLTSQIEKLQLNLSEQEQKLSEKIKEQEAFINTLQKEKIKMQVSLKNHEVELKDRKRKDETRDKDVSSVKENLSQQLEKANSIISEKVLFNDSCVQFMNTLNTPIVQRQKHGKLVSLMTKLQSFMYDFSRQLSDLYTFLMQRLCIPSCEMSIKAIVLKLDYFLRESIPCIKTIPINFEKIANAVKDESLAWDKRSVLEFSKSFEMYVLQLDKMLPYIILRIECKESWVGSSQKAIELLPKLVLLPRKILNAFKTLQRYMQVLGLFGTSEKDVHYSTQPAVLRKIFSNINLLQSSFDEARKLFGSKIAADHQLPMYSDSEKSTDECIVSALVSLSSILKKIADLIEKDLAIVSSDVWYTPRKFSKWNGATFHECVWKYKDRGTKYIQNISQNELHSIPYEVALKNHQTLRDNADNHENLTQQLEQYRNKLMQLELDKENWMLECQLMKAKESQNSQITTNGEENFKTYDSEEIHTYVKNTVNQLVKQIQLADSKSIAFRNECETLHQRLKMNLQKSETLEKETTNAKEFIDILKEEQKTLKQSYEDQLNTMSEHLANLNETLTAQKDEIDNLKQANKGNKKGKSK